jgi:hypothetical protein
MQAHPVRTNPARPTMPSLAKRMAIRLHRVEPNEKEGADAESSIEVCTAYCPGPGDGYISAFDGICNVNHGTRVLAAAVRCTPRNMAELVCTYTESKESPGDHVLQHTPDLRRRWGLHGILCTVLWVLCPASRSCRTFGFSGELPRPALPNEQPSDVTCTWRRNLPVCAICAYDAAHGKASSRCRTLRESGWLPIEAESL